MNITGYGQYSKQTAGIKDPKKIMNMQHKLIFIYPILIADKVKSPAVQSLDNLLRDFISVTFLSDIFVQNSFNVIGIANQVRPLWDENAQAVDPTSAIVRMFGAQQGMYQTGPVLPNYPVGPEHTATIQQKLTQKTAVIQHLLKTDPKFTKLRPFVELITLGNMIEVPVIVGTACYPVDTLTLLWVLIAAIGLNRKLNNEQDLEVIFRELKSMNEAKYWKLLSNLTKTPEETQTLSDYFRGKAFTGLKYVGGIKSLPTVSKVAKNWATSLQKRIESPPQLRQQREIFQPLYLKQSDLDQTKLYLKFVLSPDFARRRFGINASNEDTKISDLAQLKLRDEMKKIQDVTMSNFSHMVSTIGIVLLRSVTNLLNVNPTYVDFSEQRKANLDNSLLSKIDSDLAEILEAIDKGIRGSSSDEARHKIKILKDLCSINSGELLTDFANNLADNSISSTDFDLDTYKRFISVFDDISNSSSSLSSRIENELKYLVSNQEKPIILSRLKEIQQDISKSLEQFIQAYQQELRDSDPADYCRLSDITGENVVSIANRTAEKYKAGISEFFYFMLLSQLQVSLCKFILVADVDLETTSNEVTAWPNYTLVLPVEIIMALHAATMGMSWKHTLAGGQIGQEISKEKNQKLTKEQVSTRGLFDVNDNYVKGIIKYIAKRLDVPNLIVIDAKKNDMYYLLMNQTDVNKTKLTTIETFIKSKLDRPIISQY